MRSSVDENEATMENASTTPAFPSRRSRASSDWRVGSNRERDLMLVSQSSSRISTLGSVVIAESIDRTMLAGLCLSGGPVCDSLAEKRHTYLSRPKRVMPSFHEASNGKCIKRAMVEAKENYLWALAVRYEGVKV